MPSPARRDSSGAYSAMNRWVALAPAYPPLAGDPMTAAPLLTTTTRLPGRSGGSSAARSQPNAILTSACQLTENVSQVWCWSGSITGLAPGDQDEDLRLVLVEQAPRHRLLGRVGDLGPDVRAGGGQFGKGRAGSVATATTGAPVSAKRAGDPAP